MRDPSVSLSLSVLLPSSITVQRHANWSNEELRPSVWVSRPRASPRAVLVFVSLHRTPKKCWIRYVLCCYFALRLRIMMRSGSSIQNLSVATLTVPLWGLIFYAMLSTQLTYSSLIFDGCTGDRSHGWSGWRPPPQVFTIASPSWTSYIWGKPKAPRGSSGLILQLSVQRHEEQMRHHLQSKWKRIISASISVSHHYLFTTLILLSIVIPFFFLSIWP